METPLLYMPLLHGNISLFQTKAVSGAQSVGVGFEESTPHTWTPPTYPFTAQEVQACLLDMKAMGEAALSGVPLQALATLQSPYSQLQAVEEQEALDAFVQQNQQQKDSESTPNTVQKNVASIHVQRTAQKFLLWAWLMEEHIYEIQHLSKNYSENIHTLVDALGVEHDEALASLENIQTALGDMNFPLPPWELVVENAALFLPDGCSVLINSQEMAQALVEILTEEDLLQPLGEESRQKYGLQSAQGKECVASVGLLLQKNEKALKAAPWLEKKLHCIILESW